MTAEINSSPINLNGQVAVVTGAGRGIGRAIAQALAAAGATVAVISRSANELAQTVALIQSAGGKAHLHALDVTDAPAVRAAVSNISSSLGPIDLLVNNVGVIGPLGPFWENDFDAWWRAMDINLRGQLLCAHAVLPQMISRRRGRIINVASGAGVTPFANLSAYVSSKAALIRFTENLAVEAKPFGVSVFAITPGTVRTSMAESSLQSSEGQKWIPWFQRIFDQGLDVPADRAAQLALALASGNADSLSGCFISVHDDLAALLKNGAEIERDSLYSLRLRKLPSQKGNPAISSILTSAGNPSS